MKKSFVKKLSVLLVVMLVINAFSVLAVPTMASAASKTHTVGDFSVKVPTSYQKKTQDVGINKQAIFAKGQTAILVQSTYLGMDIDNDTIKQALQQVITGTYSNNFKNLKWGKASTGVGTAMKATCKLTANGVSTSCKIYGVCKNKSMLIVMCMGTSSKTDKAILKSAKRK